MTQHYIFQTESDFVFCTEEQNPAVENHGEITLLKSKKCTKSLESCLNCMADCLGV